jgi:hypothetical protein
VAPAADLSGLREIALPPPVPYVPQTVGWLIVAALLLVALAWVAWRWRRRWLADRYRRTALGELAVIERGLPAAAAAIPALVKRTALVFAPRATIARLTDAEWLAYLDRTFPPGGFVAGPGRLLPRLAYAPAGDLDRGQLRDLVALVRRWIEGHRAGA